MLVCLAGGGWLRFLEGVLVGVELCLFEAVSTKKSAGNGFVGSSEARGC